MHFLGAEYAKNAFLAGRGSAPDPAGGAYSAPSDPLAGFNGPTSKGRRGGRGAEGRGGKEARASIGTTGDSMHQYGIPKCVTEILGRAKIRKLGDKV